MVTTLLDEAKRSVSTLATETQGHRDRTQRVASRWSGWRMHWGQPGIDQAVVKFATDLGHRFTMDVGEVLLGRDRAEVAAACRRAAHTWPVIVGFATRRRQAARQRQEAGWDFSGQQEGAPQAAR